MVNGGGTSSYGYVWYSVANLHNQIACPSYINHGTLTPPRGLARSR